MIELPVPQVPGLPGVSPENVVVPMSAPRPHNATDLALAPVLIEMERNLERVRASDDLEFALALALNDDSGWYHTAQERAGRVLRAATRGVDLHGWEIHPTPDLHGLAVGHGGYRVSLMFGRRLTGYVGEPAGAGHAAPAAGSTAR